MNLHEAIEVQSSWLYSSEPYLHPVLIIAIRLSIEAMKAFECGREGLRTDFCTLLDGETKGDKNEPN